jgi:hypothetical protein
MDQHLERICEVTEQALEHMHNNLKEVNNSIKTQKK